MNAVNVDQAEINKFSKTTNEWWDTNGDFRTLHRLNPLRLDYIQKTSPVANKKVLDVGCGGGILSEALCREGALVTGIDMGEQAIDAAKSHMQISELTITYLCTVCRAVCREKFEPVRHCRLYGVDRTRTESILFDSSMFADAEAGRTPVSVHPKSHAKKLAAWNSRSRAHIEPPAPRNSSVS